MRAPAKSQGLSPQLSDSFVNGGGLGGGVVLPFFFFSEGGGQKTARVNDGEREGEGGGATQDNSPDVGSFTDTGNA